MVFDFLLNTFCSQTDEQYAICQIIGESILHIPAIMWYILA